MPKNNPIVSVILTAYKEPLSWFRDALQSISTQTFKNLEILVVLDNPEDETLTDYLEDITLKDSRIRLIKNDVNLGLAGSLNKAIPLTKGKYLCRMDADDIARPYRIEKQLEHLERTNYDLI